MRLLVDGLNKVKEGRMNNIDLFGQGWNRAAGPWLTHCGVYRIALTAKNVGRAHTDEQLQCRPNEVIDRQRDPEPGAEWFGPKGVSQCIPAGCIEGGRDRAITGGNRSRMYSRPLPWKETCQYRALFEAKAEVAAEGGTEPFACAPDGRRWRRCRWRAERRCARPHAQAQAAEH